MNIRPALRADVAAMSRLHGRGFTQAWDEASLTSLLESPGAFGVVIEEGVVVGFILIRVAADEAEILTVAVSPALRQRGFGTQLLGQASREALDRGAGRMFLEVSATNHAAQKLYGNYGFGPIGRRKAYYEDGADALVLSASLPLSLRMGNPGKTL